MAACALDVGVIEQRVRTQLLEHGIHLVFLETTEVNFVILQCRWLIEETRRAAGIYPNYRLFGYFVVMSYCL